MYLAVTVFALIALKMQTSCRILQPGAFAGGAVADLFNG
jgi:hypothetical protein